MKIYRNRGTNHTPVDFEYLMRAGVILDVHEFLTDHISYNELFNVFDNKMPVDLFKGHYDKGIKAITIISGLTWINERMKQLDILIENGNTEVKETTVYKAKNRRREDYSSRGSWRTRNRKRPRIWSH